MIGSLIGEKNNLNSKVREPCGKEYLKYGKKQPKSCF